jgi:6-phosphofructokinase 1
METSIKYIDPSYTVRSVPANAADSMYCMLLAQNAVHGAMAGFTGFSVGLVNNVAVYLPIPILVESSPRSMDPYGKTWDQILSMTGQPNTAPKKTQGNTTLSTSATDKQQADVATKPEFPSLPEPMIH